MATTLRTDKKLTANVQITSKDVWEHLHDLAHYQLPAAGSYKVKGHLRGQIRQSLTTGAKTDYVALIAGVFVDGVLVPDSESLVAFSRTDDLNVNGFTGCPEWEVTWDGSGGGVLEVKFKAFYNPATRDNANDIVVIPQDQFGRCWYNVDPV